MILTIHDTSNNPLGNIICKENDKMYCIRQQVRKLFIEQDTGQYVWKCTLYQKDMRVIGDKEKTVYQPTVIYSNIRKIHGIYPTMNPYDYIKYWDEDCQYHEEAIDYMNHCFDAMLNASKIDEFTIVDAYGDLIHELDDVIEPILITWILHEKQNEKLLDPLQWKLWYYTMDLMHPDEYVGYRKLFRFQEDYYELAITMSTCYCLNKEICSYCSTQTHTEFRFLLVYYGHIDHDEIVLRHNRRIPIPKDDLITDRPWNIPY